MLNAGKDSSEQTVVLPVDTVVICAGQEPHNYLYEPLKKQYGDKKIFLIGGAYKAGELDAKRAIDQGK